MKFELGTNESPGLADWSVFWNSFWSKFIPLLFDKLQRSLVCMINVSLCLKPLLLQMRVEIDHRTDIHRHHTFISIKVLSRTLASIYDIQGFKAVNIPLLRASFDSILVRKEKKVVVYGWLVCVMPEVLGTNYFQNIWRIAVKLAVHDQHQVQLFLWW